MIRMLAAFVLFAQGAEDAVKDGGPAGMSRELVTMLPIFIIIAAFFFMVVLPAQRKEKKQRQELFANLKKNDEVLTSSGIVGIVQTVRPDDDEVRLKIDDNCTVRIKKSSISQILKSKEEPAAK
jgi:preprotein translocase subunit YajC